MTPKTAKPEPKVVVNLVPGKLTPAQVEAGKRFWARLISETKAGEAVQHE